MSEPRQNAPNPDGSKHRARRAQAAPDMTGEVPGGRAAPKEHRRPAGKLTRAEKSDRTRKAILRAAAEIVGEHGYNEASIARIMERAGLGHGTFYAYFESRAQLFDQLLPTTGLELLDLLHERVKGSANLVEMEIRGFVGFLEYADTHPWFFRLLDEAKIAAPAAHRRHIDNIMQRFSKALRRSWDKGELPGYRLEELEALAYLLISARDYVFSQHVGRSSNRPAALGSAVETYRKFISFGLRGSPEAGEPRAVSDKAAGG